MKKIIPFLTLISASVQAQEKLPDTIEAGWQGKPVCEVRYEDEQIRTGTCTYPPGVGQERHTHGPYFNYTISGGQLRVTSAAGTRDFDIIAGRSSKSDGVEWHELLNVGQTTIQFLFIETKYENK